MKRIKISKNLFLRIAILTVVVYIVFLLVQLQFEINIKRQELSRVTALCSEQIDKNKELNRLLIVGEDKENVERIARDKLGYAYPDERIFYDISGS